MRTYVVVVQLEGVAAGNKLVVHPLFVNPNCKSDELVLLNDVSESRLCQLQATRELL